jgi:tetratricopeptide (TPR) repeat protein
MTARLCCATVLALGLVLVAACGSQSRQVGGTSGYLAAQKQSARTLESDGRLAEALVRWQSLLPVAAGDAEVTTAIDDLEKRIEVRAVEYRRRGQQALESGDTKSASAWFQRVLALTPGDSLSLAELAAIQSRQVHAQQDRKSSEENAALMARRSGGVNARLARFESLYDAELYESLLKQSSQLSAADRRPLRELETGAHLALADRAEAEGDDAAAIAHLEEALELQEEKDESLAARVLALRQSLGQSYYEQGVTLMKTDVEGAILALEQAVTWDPDNNSARRSLVTARRMQQNLQRIERRRASGN